MKTTRLAIAIIAALAMHAHAQDDERRPGPPPGHRPPPGGPLFAALDTDRDGQLSTDEMDKAPEVLKALDENGDGYLDPHEIHPKPPQNENESDSNDNTSTESTSE